MGLRGLAERAREEPGVRGDVRLGLSEVIKGNGLQVLLIGFRPSSSHHLFTALGTVTCLASP